MAHETRKLQFAQAIPDLPDFELDGIRAHGSCRVVVPGEKLIESGQTDGSFLAIGDRTVAAFDRTTGSIVAATRVYPLPSTKG